MGNRPPYPREVRERAVRMVSSSTGTSATACTACARTVVRVRAGRIGGAPVPRR